MSLRTRALLAVALTVGFYVLALGLIAGMIRILFIPNVPGRVNGFCLFGAILIAVSMSVNYIGSPIGSALAGPLIGRSLDVALWMAVALSLVAAIIPMFTIPARDDARVPAIGRADS